MLRSPRRPETALGGTSPLVAFGDWRPRHCRFAVATRNWWVATGDRLLLCIEGVRLASSRSCQYLCLEGQHLSIQTSLLYIVEHLAEHLIGMTSVVTHHSNT